MIADPFRSSSAYRCGCFTLEPGLVHFDRKTSGCRNHNSLNGSPFVYPVVCKERPVNLKAHYEKIQFSSKCDEGYEITTKEECVLAGQAVGAYLVESTSDLVQGDWGHTPVSLSIHLKLL